MRGQGRHILGLGLASFIPTSLAAIGTQCAEAGSGRLCVSVALPPSSASNSDSVYFQLSAPVMRGWAAFGTGQRMAGSLMFVIYQDGNGGITISPRRGRGHFLPQYDESVEIEQLDGTEVGDQAMVANFECKGCRSELQESDGRLEFIYAAGTTQNVVSSEPDVAFRPHDVNGPFNPTIQTNDIEEEGSNPFTNFIGGITPNRSGGSGGSSGQDNSDSGNDPPDVQRSSAPSFSTQRRTVLIHAILMAASFLLLFPLGALFLRLPIFSAGIARVRAHYLTQVVSYLSVLAGFGLIIDQCEKKNNHWDSTHQRLGLVPPILLFIQALLGTVHHALYKRKGSSHGIGTAHVWLGRATLIIGWVAAGLGVKLAYDKGIIEDKNTYTGLVAAVGAISGLWFIVVAIGAVMQILGRKEPREKGRR